MLKFDVVYIVNGAIKPLSISLKVRINFEYTVIVLSALTLNTIVYRSIQYFQKIL